jgi:hypothetical protein
MEPLKGEKENIETPLPLQSAEKKALHPIDSGTDIGALSVTELAE